MVMFHQSNTHMFPLTHLTHTSTLTHLPAHTHSHTSPAHTHTPLFTHIVLVYVHHHELAVHPLVARVQLDTGVVLEEELHQVVHPEREDGTTLTGPPPPPPPHTPLAGQLLTMQNTRAWSEILQVIPPFKSSDHAAPPPPLPHWTTTRCHTSPVIGDGKPDVVLEVLSRDTHPSHHRRKGELAFTRHTQVEELGKTGAKRDQWALYRRLL